MKTTTMKLEIAVTYVLNGTNPAALRENLLAIASHAAAEGLMSRGTDAEVEEWQARVIDPPTAKNRPFFPKDVLDGIDNEHCMDWDDETRQHLLFAFIAEHCDPQAFADYLGGQARAELEEMESALEGLPNLPS